jgi:hypothetical protein
MAVGHWPGVERFSEKIVLFGKSRRFWRFFPHLKRYDSLAKVII